MKLGMTQVIARKLAANLSMFLARNGGVITKYHDDEAGRFYLWAKFNKKPMKKLFEAYGALNFIIYFCEIYTFENEVRIVIPYDKDAYVYYCE